MLQQSNIEINGNEYQILLFGCKQSIKLAGRISNLIKDGITGEESNIASMLVSAMSHPEMLSLVEELVSTATFKGTKINFDEHFSKHRKDLLPLVTFSISENILPFFDPAALAEVMERLAKSVPDFYSE